jgi:hypothetical protein
MFRLTLVSWGVFLVAAVAGCGSKSNANDGGGGNAGASAGAGGRGGSAGAAGGAGGGGAGVTGGSGGGVAGASGGSGGAAGGAAGSTGTGGSGGVGGTGSGACAFASTYTVVDSMGLVGANSAMLTPPNSVHLTRITYRQNPGQGSCDPPLPACNDPALLDVRDVEAAIAHPDVQAALAMATVPVYGDLGIADGPALTFTRGDGHGVAAQSNCTTPSMFCKPIPPGVSALVTLLRGLIYQQLMDPACSAVADAGQ